MHMPLIIYQIISCPPVPCKLNHGPVCGAYDDSTVQEFLDVCIVCDGIGLQGIPCIYVS